MRRFEEYTDEELAEELKAQRSLMRDGRKSRNPYYNPGPGMLRLADIEDEIALRKGAKS